MRKNIYSVLLLLLISIGLSNCKKLDTDFKSFLNGKELIYPGVVAKLNSAPGNLRTAILWNPSSDPSITRYVVYWNNKADSVVFNSSDHKTTDTLKVIIPNLNEYIYSFTIYAYDAKGNKSIPTDLNNVKVYGPVYQSGLVNRGYDVVTPFKVASNGNVKLNFLAKDTTVINVGTTIRYMNKSGVSTDKIMSHDSSSITLTDYKAGTNIQFRSSYVPVKNAIDTFAVSNFEAFPTPFVLVMCDKSLFKEMHLPNDVTPYDPSATTISKLWDGSVGPQGYPNIWHSDGNSPLPHVLTFDMGAIYTGLNQVEETGRNGSYHSPVDFEVWGIADITNATTTLNAHDAGWKAEALAKGWVLLKEVVRSDDGQVAFKVNLIDNPPPVRYIRIRVITVADKDNSYSNMSQVTFFNKQ
jgi:hypothetical protein